MQPLIAILTCASTKFVERASSQRETWVSEALQHFDVKFFLAGDAEQRDDTVTLNCGDTYLDLPFKLQSMVCWALRHGYDHVAKLDDDVYCVPENMIRCEVEARPFDLVGRYRGPSGGFEYAYPSGAAYWLSRRAMEVIATAEVNDVSEDRWVGNTIARARLFRGHNGFSYKHVGSASKMNFWKPPSVAGFAASIAELNPDEMRQSHQNYLKWVCDYRKQVRFKPPRITPVTT